MAVEAFLAIEDLALRAVLAVVNAVLDSMMVIVLFKGEKLEGKGGFVVLVVLVIADGEEKDTTSTSTVLLYPTLLPLYAILRTGSPISSLVCVSLVCGKSRPDMAKAPLRFSDKQQHFRQVRHSSHSTNTRAI